MTKLFYKTKRSYQVTAGIVIPGESMTIPGESRSIAELLQREVATDPYYVRQRQEAASYTNPKSVDEVSDVNRAWMDLTDLEALQSANVATLDTLKAAIEDARRAKESADPPADPPADPADPVNPEDDA